MANTKDVTINGVNYRIKKFNARTGSFMLLKIVGLLAPLAKTVDWKKLLGTEGVPDPTKVDMSAVNLIGIAEELGKLSEEDFTYIQENCLKVCDQILPGVMNPVLHPNGSIGVIGLEEDTMSLMALTIHALVFNVMGFFQGSPLTSVIGGLFSTKSQD